MVPGLRALSSGAVVLAISACTPTGERDRDARGSSAHTDPQLAELDTSVALATEYVSGGDAHAALAELLIAADLAAEFGQGDPVACRFGADAAELADDLLTDGAYGEARTTLAVAIHYVKGCEATLPAQLHVESLRNRQLDARAVQQWLAGV